MLNSKRNKLARVWGEISNGLKWRLKTRLVEIFLGAHQKASFMTFSHFRLLAVSPRFWYAFALRSAKNGAVPSILDD